MIKLLVLSGGRRLLTLMLLSFCVSSYARAQQPGPHNAPSLMGAATEESVTIDAVVTEVQGTILKLEGGLSIDISDAYLFLITGLPADRSLIKPGTCIRATAAISGDSAAPLAAEFVRIRVPNEIMLSGILQAVDLDVNAGGEVTGGSVTILNRKVLVKGGLMPIGLRRKALKVGKPMFVVAAASGSELVAVLFLPGVFLPRIAP